MPEIVLTTLNAKYIHTAFGLRYLLANLGPLRATTRLIEFEIKQRPLEIAEAILSLAPKVVGIGVYVWNVVPVTELVAILKRVRPELVVILGGPEVGFPDDLPPVASLADYVITGEADLKFAEVCHRLLREETTVSPAPLIDPQRAGPIPLSPALSSRSAAGPGVEHGETGGQAQTRLDSKIIRAGFPRLDQIVPPYDCYTDDDIAHRILYVEASRGCPFGCEFCLSSLEVPVRLAPLATLLDQLQRLLARGARHLKFVDRTFNASLPAARAILEFLLQSCRPGLLFHFEMVPDRLPDELKELIARFPAGALQLEVGVQSFNEAVCARISRRQDQHQTEENLNFLREHTGVHLHTDLVAGLPGESLQSFAAGFDRLIGLRPQEIQVGILKRLRGAPITRHDVAWQMAYNPNPPYDILQNSLLDFATVQRLRRFARYWDLVGNSGSFVETTRLIVSGIHRPVAHRPHCQEPSPPPSPDSERKQDEARSATHPVPSAFHAFLHWSDWLHEHVGRTDSIALHRLAQLLFDYLITELGCDPPEAARTIWRDYQRVGRGEKPAFLRRFIPDSAADRPDQKRPDGPARQARHRTGAIANGGVTRLHQAVINSQ